MVSDFVEEHDGYLVLSTGEHDAAKKKFPLIPRSARVLFEYGADKEGYWTGDKFMANVKDACDTAESKYDPAKHTIEFVFDQSSCHKKFDEKALIAKSILVKDGGPHRVCDTVWAGQPQAMVNSDRSAKGLRTILAERGINTARMKADDMRTVLSNHDDFKHERQMLNIMLKAVDISHSFYPSSTAS